MGYKILAINPGSTSMKISIYENEKELFKQGFEHSTEELKKYARVADQFEMRRDVVLNYLEEINFDINELSAIVGRGGLLPPVKAGAYLVDETMVDVLKNRPAVEHASNLGGIIAYEIAKPLNIPAFIYDSVAVDQLEEIARISGMPEIERLSHSHALNSRAVAIKVSGMLEKKYDEMNYIVAHLGGGISITAHQNGRMIDVVSDDEGPFSPERAGRVPCKNLVKMCYSDKYTKEAILKRFRGTGGLAGYLNTNSALDVEAMIAEGDEKAKLLYDAMAYQISKGIGELATVLCGKVDRIIVTGGIAYSKMVTENIKKRVSFIAPVEVVPGENELESLALGALRVIKGEEKASTFEE